MAAEFKIIDHTADIAMEISGSNYEELFLAAFNGLKNSLLETSESDKEKSVKSLSLQEDSIEELLVSFLGELNYYFESKKIFPLEIRQLQIVKDDKTFRLKSTCIFGNITADDIVKTEIKAITFHQLDVRKVNNGYKTIIVFDI